MVSDDGVDFHFAKESTFSLDNAEKEDSDRDTDGCIYPVLDAGEDRNNDSGEENDNFER